MPTRIDTTPDSGSLFFLAAEDPIRFRVDVYAFEAPAPELNREFEPLGGGFLLEAPSGLLTVSGTDPAGAGSVASLAVSAGPHILTVMGRRPFDGRRHQAEMVTLLGEADWRFTERAQRVLLLGCLPALMAFGALIYAIWHARWGHFLAFALPLILLAAAPHLILRRSARYQRLQRRMAEHEAAKPLFILTLVPTERTSGLTGGFLNV